MTWRYQAVWHEKGDSRFYTIYEVCVNDDGQLKIWTNQRPFSPGGESWDELQLDLGKMYEDCWNWQPIHITELRPGVTFQRNPRSEKPGEKT